nr:ribonuclease H-like domain-containing protein [Tanacetum cinerariifolium]
CDSLRDLYPVTSPSPTPHDLVSVSPSAWHQRLGHPDPNRKDNMYDKYNALIKNRTWVLVPKPLNINVVWSMCRQFGVDCDDTFRPIVKLATIRTVLSLALSWNWPIYQLDVKNAFLNGDLSKTMYMYQPPAFVDAQFPHHVCLHMHDPREPHLASLKRVLRYVRGTLDFRLQLYASITGSFVVYTMLIGLVSLLPGGLHLVILFSWEIIYSHGQPNANILSLDRVLKLSTETKHIEIDIHFVRNMVACGQVHVLHVPSHYPYADIFTKGLPSVVFEKFCTSLSVRASPAQTAEEFMPSSNHPIIVSSDSDIKDAFSFTNVLDYFPATPGNTSHDSSNDLTKFLPFEEISPKDTETSESPTPVSPSSSIGSSSPVRLTTPLTDYPFDESIFTELDNSLWIISRPLGGEPDPEKPNESDAYDHLWK